MTHDSEKRFFVRCRIFRSHSWVMRRSEDGGRYQACRRCGRDNAAASRMGVGVSDGGGFGGGFGGF